MNQVRYKPKFIIALKVWCVIGVMMSAFALYIIRHNQSDRAHFLHEYVEETCTIAKKEVKRGKGTSLFRYLSCPGPVSERKEEINESQYEKEFTGDYVTLFYWKQRPEIWRSQIPTQEWHKAQTNKEWGIFYVLVVGFFGIVAAVGLYARDQKEFLSDSQLFDAEVVKITAAAQTLTVVVMVPFNGEMKNVALALYRADENQNYLDLRTLKVAVGHKPPFRVKAVNQLSSVELYPSA